MQAATPKLDARQRQRFSCHRPLSGKLMLSSAAAPLQVRVRDLSGTGIGFLAARPVEVGQEVIVRLSKSPTGSIIRFSATIVHCNRANDDNWHVGCRLGEQALDAILDYLVS